MLGCMSTRKDSDSWTRISLDQHSGRPPGNASGDAAAIRLLPSEGAP